MTREELLSALHLQNSAQEDQDKTINNILVVVNYRFADVMDETITEDQIEQLNSITEKGDSELVTNWIKENIPNATETYEEILRDYIESLQSEIES